MCFTVKWLCFLLKFLIRCESCVFLWFCDCSLLCRALLFGLVRLCCLCFVFGRVGFCFACVDFRVDFQSCVFISNLGCVNFRSLHTHSMLTVRFLQFLFVYRTFGWCVDVFDVVMFAMFSHGFVSCE